MGSCSCCGWWFLEEVNALVERGRGCFYFIFLLAFVFITNAASDLVRLTQQLGKGFLRPDIVSLVRNSFSSINTKL